MFEKIFNLLPIKNKIVFESAPDFGDNSLFIYNELVKRQFDKKYKLVWLTYDKFNAEHKNIKQVKFSSILKTKYLLHTAKVIVFCNHLQNKKRKEQYSIYIQHGSPNKDCSSYFRVGECGADAYVCQSEFFKEPSATSTVIPIDKLEALGLPRCDSLIIDNDIDIKKMFDTNCRIIFWCPTVKNYAGGEVRGNGRAFSFGDIDSLNKINEAAKANNMLIIIKPHFAQVKNYENVSFSNIRIIDDNFFKKQNVTLYQVLKHTDGMISDYSSIVYDYLATSKPMVLIWDDLKEYKQNPGLLKEFELIGKLSSTIVTNIDEFIHYLYNYDEMNKNYVEGIKKAQQLVYPFEDLTSTKRVTDFIIEKFKL